MSSTACVIGISIPSSAARRATSRARTDAFGDVAKVGKNCLQFPPLRQRQTNTPVARQITGAGQHQVAHAGQPHEGFGLPAERYAEPGDLGQAACHQRGAGVVPEPEPVADAGGNGHDILDRAADLGADDIIVGVNAQSGAVQFERRLPGKFGESGGQGDGRRQAARDPPRRSSGRSARPHSAPAPSSSATIWCGKLPLCASIPLHTQTSGFTCPISTRRRSVARKPASGVATISKSASCTAAPKSVAIASASGKRWPGKNCRFSRSASIVCVTSTSRVHKVTRCLALKTMASAVPQAPAAMRVRFKLEA